jgi:hypothetical protein
MHSPTLANDFSFRLTLAFAPFQPFLSRRARRHPSKSCVLTLLRTLFLSLRSFRPSPRLFSIACGLFLQNTGGVGYLGDTSAPLRYHLPLFCRPLFSSTYKSLLIAHRFATLSVFIHLQIPFSATSLYSHLYKTPGCGIQIMVNHRLNHARPGGSYFFRGIKEFDSYERNFGLESRCWSIIRATNRAAQPREIRPNTRVKTKAVTGRSPKPAAGGVAATKGGSQQNESDPGFLARHTRSRIPRRCRQSWHPRTKILEWRRVRIL